MKIAAVHFNNAFSNTFDSIANKYWQVTSFNEDTTQTVSQIHLLHDKLKLFDHIIITLSSATDLNLSLRNFISELEKSRKIIVVLSGPAGNLIHLESCKGPVIWSEYENEESASLTAQLIFGGISSSNRLSNHYSKKFRKGNGFKIEKLRLGYGMPESVNLNTEFVDQIDSLITEGIRAHAAPAVVILLAKDGKVIYNKAFGSHTYQGPETTSINDIFDMASVTKVTATTPVIMQLYEKKQIDLDSPISRYVHVLKDIDDKKELSIKEALLHEAGFTPYIKFYEQVKPLDMKFSGSAAFPTPVAENYFLRADYFQEVMWPVTLRSPVLTRGKFVYSDVSMYMMKEVAENVSNTKLDDYVLNRIYLPLGMQYSGYLPLKRFDKSRIVPTTENDNWLRNMQVRGYVNDPGAAMSGGVQGHAGLFSTANDLAIFYQMMLNKGTYGGEKIFEPATVKLFTSRQSKTTTRGLGFARAPEQPAGGPVYPSAQSYGHSGYTGTYVWVDPAYNLLYICLTNRVYPDDGKTFGVSKINIRALALELFYKAIIAGR
jgi:CubicO group peptidase (beta-lactamase class C family)